jgi:hypothetical protein
MELTKAGLILHVAGKKQRRFVVILCRGSRLVDDRLEHFATWRLLPVSRRFYRLKIKLVSKQLYIRR